MTASTRQTSLRSLPVCGASDKDDCSDSGWDNFAIPAGSGNDVFDGGDDRAGVNTSADCCTIVCAVSRTACDGGVRVAYFLFDPVFLFIYEGM